MSNGAKRSIIIGDIHGCFDELQEMLTAVGAREDDELISVGDLICKGPKTKAVLDWAMNTANVRCVLGNHEARLLELRMNPKKAKSCEVEVLQELGDQSDRYMDFIARLPLYIERSEVLVVHAGIDPRKPFKAQSTSDLLTLRKLTDIDRPWHELYTEKRLIVYGHWARQGLMVRPNSVGLDSSCVYGGHLSALILPERRIVQVRARRQYVNPEAIK